MRLQIIYLIYLYKEDLAINKLLGLISQKITTNQPNDQPTKQPTNQMIWKPWSENQMIWKPTDLKTNQPNDLKILTEFGAISRTVWGEFSYFNFADVTLAQCLYCWTAASK